MPALPRPGDGRKDKGIFYRGIIRHSSEAAQGAQGAILRVFRLRDGHGKQIEFLFFFRNIQGSFEFFRKVNIEAVARPYREIALIGDVKLDAGSHGKIMSGDEDAI